MTQRDDPRGALRLCDHCDGPINDTRRADSKFCSDRCEDLSARIPAPKKRLTPRATPLALIREAQLILSELDENLLALRSNGAITLADALPFLVKHGKERKHLTNVAKRMTKSERK